MVTGEPGFAKSYLLTEQVERNAIPTAPPLVLPKNNATLTTNTISFNWNKATDLDSDPLTYRLCVWGVDESYTFKNCSVVSSQTPSWEVKLDSGKAYFWKVIAEDGKGGNTESETRRLTTPQHRIFLPFVRR